jgi:hypothetical protein
MAVLPYPGNPPRTLRAIGGGSAAGPSHSRPIAALQFFGRYRGYSGHRDGVESGGSVANDPKQTWSVGSYLGPLLASFFLISGLSYKTTFNSELRISSFPLYSI